MCTKKIAENGNKTKVRWKSDGCKIKITPFCKQLWVSLGVGVNSTAQGCVIGYMTIFLDQLRTPNTLVQISTSDGSWIASIIGIGLLAGNMITPYVMEKYGRKIAHLATNIPIMIGWMLFIFSNSIPVLIFARFLHGCSLGMFPILAGVIIGECSSPVNRGGFMTAMALGLAFGGLFVHFVGYFLHWRLTALVAAMFSVLSMIIVLLSPETPSWLASKQKYDECRKAFVWLRGSDDKNQLEELEIMINARKIEHDADVKNTKIDIKTKIMEREFYIPIVIMFHVYVLYQFSGTNVFLAYTIDILNRLLGGKHDPYVWMMTFDIIRLIFTIIGAVLLRVLKRRVLLFSSGALCFTGLIGISIYSYLKTFNYISGNAVIPLVFIFAYVCSLSVGIISLPFALPGEIFPVRYKSLGGGLSSVILSITFFSSVKTALPLFETIGLYGAFFMYALILSYCLLVLWFILPETKDRTLQDIEDILRGSKYDKSDVTDLKVIELLQPRTNLKVNFKTPEKNGQHLVSEIA